MFTVNISGAIISVTNACGDNNKPSSTTPKPIRLEKAQGLKTYNFFVSSSALSTSSGPFSRRLLIFSKIIYFLFIDYKLLISIKIT